MKRLKNTTGADLFHDNSGINLISGQYIEVDESIVYRCLDTQMWNWFDNGDVIFNDGTSDYTNKYEGWHRFGSYAFGIPFLSETNSTRNNDFTSISVQEAIEESKSTTEGKSRFVIGIIHNGTIGDEDYFGYNELINGYDTPLLVAKDSTFVEFTFSNQKDNASYSLYFFRNDPDGTPFLTVSKTDTQYFVYTGISQNFNSGDRIYVQYIDNGINASDIGINLYFRPI